MAICNNIKYEREFVKIMTKLNITCFRIAGSGSAKEAVSDCVMYLPEPCLVEVKATKEKIFYMRKGVREQLQLMINDCEKNNLIPILAIKFKNKGWNIHKINSLQNISFDKKRCDHENLRQDIIDT